MSKIVFSLAPLSAEIVELLIRQTPGLPNFEVIAGHEMSEEKISKNLANADIVLGDYTFKHKITAHRITGAKKLVFIQQPSVGYQHIDVAACSAAGIRVANTAGANTVSVAEHTIAWGLGLLKNMFHAHVSTKAGRWEQMNIKAAELNGKVWGIVGFGNIGRAVAERLKPFGLSRMIYYDIRRAEPSVEQKTGVEYADRETLLRQADIVSLHAPLTAETRAMINAHAFHIMKSGAYLINVARAELVDEEALAEAVRSGKIAGAGIDVFSEEPITESNPLLGVESERLFFSPHTAGVTGEAAGRIINMAAANIARVLKGEEPESLLH
ncbi:MAG TPA: 2-hydroxyacid dehydrogenase [Smithella sp.]|nr:2-hydroxyacid dehydrogenase [Smithella sp.]